MKWIELLTAIGDHKANAFLEVEDGTADAYIRGGLARDGGSGPETVILQRALEALRGEIGGITQSVADSLSQATRGLADTRKNLHISGGESEADKKRSFGDFVRCIATADDKRTDLYSDQERSAARKMLGTPWGEGGYAVKRANVENVGSSGGYLTPVTFETELLKLDNMQPRFSDMCRQIPLGTREVRFPALNQYTAPTAGQSASYAGVQTYYKGETIARTESNPKLQQVVLNANDLTAFMQYSRDLDQDAPAFSSYLSTLVGGAIRFRENYEFFNGTGAGKPLGILNSPGILTALSGGRTTASHIKYADLVAMLNLLHPAYWSQACWFAHPFARQELVNMVDGSGRLIWLPNFPGTSYGTAGARPPEVLLGLPLVYEEVCQPVGTAGDIWLAVPQTYLKGTRAGIEIALSDQYAFNIDEIALRAKIRHDGQPWVIAPYYLADGSSSNQVSTFVNLHA